MLTGHQTQPGGHVTATGELLGVSYRRYQGTGANRTNAFNLQQAPDPVILARSCLNALVVHRYPVIDLAQFFCQFTQQRQEARRQAAVFVGLDHWQRLAQLLRSYRHHNAKLPQQTTYLIA